MAKTNETMINICGYIWLISWFTAIWTPEYYSIRLFLTGLFCFFLALLATAHDEKKGK